MRNRLPAAVPEPAHINAIATTRHIRIIFTSYSPSALALQTLQSMWHAKRCVSERPPGHADAYPTPVTGWR
jgi:hypothetical protein